MLHPYLAPFSDDGNGDTEVKEKSFEFQWKQVKGNGQVPMMSEPKLFLLLLGYA